MKILSLLSYLIIGMLLASPSGHCAVAKIILSQPAPLATPQFSEANSCRKAAQGNHLRSEATWTNDTDRGSMARTYFENYPEGKPFHEVIPNRILDRWLSQRNFSPERIQQLRQWDRELDLSRTTYLGFAHEDRSGPFDTEDHGKPFSGIRVTDGSTQPLFNGRIFPRVSAETRELSFEEDYRNSGYIFPERLREDSTGQPSYIWGISLLNVERGYFKGTHTLLGILARQIIDPHYNQNSFNIYGRTKILERNDLVVYTAARPQNVKINESLGFQVVMKPGTSEPVTQSTGLVLMKVSGVELMHRYSDFSMRPLLKNQDEAVDPAKDYDQAEQKQREGMNAFYLELEKRAPVLKSDWDFLVATYRLSRMHEALFKTPLDELKTHPALSFIPEDGVAFREIVELNRLQIFFEGVFQLAYGRLRQVFPDQPSEVESQMLVYEMILNDFSRHREAYQLFMEDVNAGRGLPLWNRAQMQMFLKEHGERLKVQDLQSDYLEDWVR